MENNDKDRDGGLSLTEESKNCFREAMRNASIRDFVAMGMSEEEAVVLVDYIAATEEVKVFTDISVVVNRQLQGQLEMDGPSSQR